jgi:hypothetical protein
VPSIKSGVGIWHDTESRLGGSAPRCSFSRHRQLAPHDLRRTCARLCHLAEANWSKFNSCLAMFRSRPPSDIWAANKSFVAPSTTKSALSPSVLITRPLATTRVFASPELCPYSRPLLHSGLKLPFAPPQPKLLASLSLEWAERARQSIVGPDRGWRVSADAAILETIIATSSGFAS